MSSEGPPPPPPCAPGAPAPSRVPLLSGNRPAPAPACGTTRGPAADAPPRPRDPPSRPGSRRFWLAHVVPSQLPVSGAAPPRERGHWCSPRVRAGHGRAAQNSAFGKGTRPGSRREPSGAAKRRKEPERPEYDRRRAGGPEADPSAAGRSRVRPKRPERGWTLGLAQPAPWLPRGQLWPEAGLLATGWPRTACSSLSARTRPRTGGAARRCRVTPSAEPTSAAGSTWAGPGAECGPRS